MTTPPLSPLAKYKWVWGDLGRNGEDTQILSPSMTPTPPLSADDLASYFMEKTEALRWNPSPFRVNLPAILPPHTGFSTSSLS